MSTGSPRDRFAAGRRESYPVILLGMKVAVSIPDAVFEAAERLAKQRRCSRSSLYAEALEGLLAVADRDQITARLDAVYKSDPSEIEPPMLQAQQRALDDNHW